MNLLKQFLFFSMILLSSISVKSQEKKIKIAGIILDETKFGIPYAAIGIPSKYIGTSSNEDGNFYLELSKNNLLDSLEVSSIGYLTSKILVKDFLALKEKSIILKEDIVSLNEVNILSPSQYVELAFKNLKNNTVSSTHELKILNRYFSVEDNKAKFLIEHYIKVKDVGPRGGIEVNKVEVLEGRKSVDYRLFRNKASRKVYPILFMTKIDPLRRGISIKDYEWTKIGDTSYDGEDIVIIQGANKAKKRQKYLDPVLYIGVDTYKVYKTRNRPSNALSIYKKNEEEKLYLSYHNHYTRRIKKLNDEELKILKRTNDEIKLADRIEVVVLGIETDKKKIKTKDSGVFRKKMKDVDVKYNANFWKNLSIPPATAFYKKSVKQLEERYGVSLERQFNAVNK